MLQKPPEQIAEFAARLLRYEAERAGGSDPFASFVMVCRSLHRQFAPLISSSGHHALFARAVRLAAREYPLLATVRIAPDADCTVTGQQDAEDAPAAAVVAAACGMAVAYFVWLLVIFIGENLALRKVSEAWPEVPLEGLLPSSRTRT